jgi:hypothetical protein
MALKVQQCLARNVTDDIKLAINQRSASRLEGVIVIEIRAHIDWGTLVPTFFVKLQPLICHCASLSK